MIIQKVNIVSSAEKLSRIEFKEKTANTNQIDNFTTRKGSEEPTEWPGDTVAFGFAC